MKSLQKEQIAQIRFHDPWSAGISVQWPLSNSTPQVTNSSLSAIMFLLTKFWKPFSLGPHFYKKLLTKQESLIEFVTGGVELLKGHCTDIPADQGSWKRICAICSFWRLFTIINLDAIGSWGIMFGKQKLGVTFNSDKLGGIDFTKFSKLTMCSA